MRKHYYRYVLKLRTPDTDASAFGNAGHRALEAWYREWMDGNLEARLPSALSAVDQSHDLTPFDRVKLVTLVHAYDARLGSEPWQVLGVEVEFRYELGGYLIGGKIDAIIRDLAGRRTYVVEHKTTAMDTSIGGAYWEKLAIDTQVSIYVDGATVLGHEIAGCIYDVIKRPLHDQLLATPTEKRKLTTGKGCKKCGGSAKAGAVMQGRGFYTVSFTTVDEIKCEDCAGTGWKLDRDGQPEAPRLHSNQRDVDETLDAFETRIIEAIAENPDAFLMRGVVVRLDAEIPRMRDDLIEQIKIERMADLLGAAPRNPESCAKYGRLCDFFDICVGRASADNEQLFPRSDTAHPELVAEAA
jgi:hypothetical protein